MVIYILRHGKTNANSKNLVQGEESDPYTNNINKLNQNGFDKSIKVGEILKNKNITYIFSSPQSRATDTSRLIQSFAKVSNSIVTSKLLSERKYGLFEGKDKKKLKDFFNKNPSEDELKEYEIETEQEVNIRIGKFFIYLENFLKEKKLTIENTNILIVSHGYTLKKLISKYYDNQIPEKQISLNNNTCIKLLKENYEIIFNETSTKDLISKIKQNISVNYYKYDPSVICLLLYGPFGFLLDKNDKRKKLTIDLDKNYIKKLETRFNSLFGKQNFFRKAYGEYDVVLEKNIKVINEMFLKTEIKNPYNLKFETFDYLSISTILYDKFFLKKDGKITLKKTNFEVDKKILSEILDKYKKQEKDEVLYLKYHYYKKEEFMIIYRFKESESLKEKYAINYNNLLNHNKTEDEKGHKEILNTFFNHEKILQESLLNFVEEVTKNPEILWENYEPNYYRRFGSIAKKFLLTDIVGFKFLFFNEKINEMIFSTKLLNDNFKELNNLKKITFRSESHISRLLEKRPGGIHLTMIEKEKRLPMEFQFLGLKSIIYDFFGENSHKNYVKKGKKLK